ncbi:hypothetical protein Tco_1106611 [Tanacetum coccineum]
MLGAAEVQIPENNLDDLHSSREEDGTSKTMDPQEKYWKPYGIRKGVEKDQGLNFNNAIEVCSCLIALFLSNNASFVFLGFSLLCAALTVSQPLVSEWQWLLGDSDHSALSCDSEEEWMVNEKNDVDEASSVSVDERNSLPSEEDSNSLLSDRTIQIDVGLQYVGGMPFTSTQKSIEQSELETSDNHNVAKELNADFIEENIYTNIGTLNNAAF